MIIVQREAASGKLFGAVLRFGGVACIVWPLSTAIAADAFHGVILLAGGLAIISGLGKTTSDWRGVACSGFFSTNEWWPNTWPSIVNSRQRYPTQHHLPSG